MFLFPVYLGYALANAIFTNEGWATDMEECLRCRHEGIGAPMWVIATRSFPNIIYVMGCDADPRSCSPPLVGKLNAVATGIKSVDSVHLMSRRQCRSAILSGCVVRVLHGWTSAICTGPLASASSTRNTRAQISCLSSKVKIRMRASIGSTPLSLRTRQYWSVLSGAYLGSFFGNNPIWCFNETNSASRDALPEWDNPGKASWVRRDRWGSRGSGSFSGRASTGNWCPTSTTRWSRQATVRARR